MNWTPLRFGRKPFSHPAAWPALTLLLGWVGGVQATPFVQLKFDDGASTSLANTGTAGGSGTLIAPNPTFSGETPINSGAYALDLGLAPGNTAVDITTPAVLTAAKNLKSFTIAGWINCRSNISWSGGNRVVSWINHGGEGVDLAYHSDGRLAIGINQWNDHGIATSNSGKIPVDPNGSYDNWRFFAVTYDETLSSNHVKFYFGTNTSDATLDRNISYDRGISGDNIGSALTIGNQNPNTRIYGNNMFRGLLDKITVYGNTTSGAGALSLAAIQALQDANPMSAPGIKYVLTTRS